MKPEVKKSVLGTMMKEYSLSERRAFRLLIKSRSYYKRKNQDLNEKLKTEVKTLCSEQRNRYL